LKHLKGQHIDKLVYTLPAKLVEMKLGYVWPKTSDINVLRSKKANEQSWSLGLSWLYSTPLDASPMSDTGRIGQVSSIVLHLSTSIRDL